MSNKLLNLEFKPSVHLFVTDIGRKYVIVADIIMNPALIKNFIAGDSEHNVDELVKASKKAWDIMSENVHLKSCDGIKALHS
mgnify:CR=1 FL=1